MHALTLEWSFFASLLFLGGWFWLAMNSYWTRVLTIGLVLAAWGSVLAFGVYVGISQIAEGSFWGLMPIIVAAGLSSLYWIAIDAAVKWVEAQKHYYGGFWKPWDAP
ncbi:hypothetical protein [Dichotomicrobium thermohalophilum]|uniref:Uncharacterized protein n=1 Tax=Dichotomicrobium thermohalophilum TaxID=933063 RepID=A0A397Q4P9_9HYPH|nr:hypothetical protein [Dichotomicrobium thermohalophilum]RIA56082.1 hypothetical protein BXY53_1178 [Dichotomicrobium thermohalophilum]